MGRIDASRLRTSHSRWSRSSDFGSRAWARKNRSRIVTCVESTARGAKSACSMSARRLPWGKCPSDRTCRTPVIVLQCSTESASESSGSPSRFEYPTGVGTPCRPADTSLATIRSISPRSEAGIPAGSWRAWFVVPLAVPRRTLNPMSKAESVSDQSLRVSGLSPAIASNRARASSLPMASSTPTSPNARVSDLCALVDARSGPAKSRSESASIPILARIRLGPLIQ